MQLKVNGMQLKVDMQNNMGGKRINKGYICSLSSSLVFFYSLLLANWRKNPFLQTISHSYLYQKEKTSFLLGESFLVILVSYLTCCNTILII